MGGVNLKRRLIGLDLFRIMATFFVFLFHTRIIIQCNYGVLNNFVGMGAIYMSGFFILSGFVLFINYKEKNIVEERNIKKFYLKRFISIFPLYYFVSLMYIIFIGDNSLIQDIFLFPIELLGLQTVFTSLFNVSHNGGTWFISCIMFAYLLYPFFQQVALKFSNKSKIRIILLLMFILIYSPIIVYKFDVFNIYSNPFFRILEFFIGVLVASIVDDVYNNKKYRFLFQIKSCLIEFIILFLIIIIGIKLNFLVNDYNGYNFIVIPMFVLMILGLSKISLNNLNNSKIIKYLSEISYSYFLAQFFTWPIVKLIIKKYQIYSNNQKILLCVIICLLIAILLHELVEKKCKKIINI